MRFLPLVLAAFVLTACGGEPQPVPAPPPRLPAGEGRLAVSGGNLWYKVSGTGKGTPVVLLHGGPGFSSYYLKPFEELGNERIVVRYDQLGGGKSDKITDTAMFNIAHFVTELDSLRSHLGYAKWHVVGHSWGTILGLEYYRAYPDRVASLTFGSAVFDIPAYEARARSLIFTLTDSAQRAIKRAEAAKRYDAPDYQNAITEFYSLYVFRRPIKADLDSTFSTVNEGIYNYLQGPSEFTITGTLSKYDATDFLPKIAVPTLFTVGEFDEVGPEIIKRHGSLVKGSKRVEFAGSAHITTWDARDENVKVVRDFLRSADATPAKAKP